MDSKGTNACDLWSNLFSIKLTDQSVCKIGLNLAVNSCVVRILHDKHLTTMLLCTENTYWVSCTIHWSRKTTRYVTKSAMNQNIHTTYKVKIRIQEPQLLRTFTLTFHDSDQLHKNLTNSKKNF